MKFPVGTNEVHWVSFEYNPFWATIKILVDGQRIPAKSHSFSWAMSTPWEFDVGVQEIHHVRIVKTRKVLLSGIRSQKLEAYVDGKLIAVGQT